MFLIVVHSSTINAIVAVSSVLDLILHFIFYGNSISKYYLLPHQGHTLGANRVVKAKLNVLFVSALQVCVCSIADNISEESFRYIVIKHVL